MQAAAEEELVPIRAVRCPFCAEWVPVDAYGVVETLWMHEYDCAEIAMDWELAA